MYIASFYFLLFSSGVNIYCLSFIFCFFVFFFGGNLHHTRDSDLKFLLSLIEVMAEFPKIPRVSMGSDEDVSLHLQSRVGPARALRYRTSVSEGKDEVIRRILNDRYDDDDDDGDDDDDFEYDKRFEDYKQSKLAKSYSLDSDSDAETQVGSDDEERRWKGGKESDHDRTSFYSTIKDINKGSIKELGLKNADNKANRSLFEQFKKSSERSGSHSTRESESFLYLSFGIISFFLTSCFLAFWYFTSMQSQTQLRPVENYYEINSKFGNIDYSIQKLNSMSEQFSTRQKEIEESNKQQLEELSEKFEKLAKEMLKFKTNEIPTSQINILSNEVASLRTKVEKTDSLADSIAHLSDINSKVERLAGFIESFESLKDTLKQDLLDHLPERIPVYIKDNKIHYLPEFHKYIYNFVDAYVNEKNLSSSYDWEGFWTSNEPQIKDYITKIVDSKGIHAIDKNLFEKSLTKKLEQNNKIMQEKFNNLVDRLNLANFSSNDSISGEFAKSAKGIALDNLLEVIAKGSIHVNYADYNLGSRILGFLTSSSVPTISKKSFPRKILLGWYDYFSSRGVKDPRGWKHNANNVLVDNADHWECESGHCSIGIRLSSPVILTNLVLKFTRDGSLESPDLVSIYVKPAHANQLGKLEEYLKDVKFDLTAKELNKYLKKFFKIKEEPFYEHGGIYVIKLPTTYINLRIPIRDVYLEFRSSRKNIGILNLKAYGISEFNAYKYTEDFDTLAGASFIESSQEYSQFDEILGNDQLILQK